MIFVFLLCIVLFVLSFLGSKNDILSPGVITSGIWIICLSLFWILHHNLPPLSIQFLGSLSIWVTLLCLSSLLMQSISTKVTIGEPSALVRDVFFWISILTFPFFLLFIHKALLLGHSGSWSMDLRMAALGKTKDFKEIYSGIHIIIWQVSYLIELFCYSKKNKKRVLILGFIFLSFAFLTMSKSAFLEFFIKTVCVLYFKHIIKIKLKYIIISLASLFFLLATLQSIRYSKKVESVNKNDFTVLYLLSSMTAFDTLTPYSTTDWGEDVFRSYYSATYKLGITSNKPHDTILPFIKKPISTNTYTVMYPFFKDFGFWGITIFSTLFGLIFGWVFNKAQRGNVFNILLFTTFVPILIMQYANELLVTSLLAYIKYILLLAIPFWASQYKVFSLNTFYKSPHE